MKKKITIFALLTTVALSTLSATVYEAETTTLSGGAIAVTDAGASGGSYVDTQNLGVVSFTFNIATSGWYSVAVATKNTDASAGRAQDFALDADPKFKIAIPLSSSFAEIAIGGTQYYTAGSHSITITKNWGYVLLDYFKIEPTTLQNIQAEKASIGTGVVYDNELVSSEGRYLSSEGSDVAFNLAIPTAGKYRISVVAKNSAGNVDRVNDFQVDGDVSTKVTLAVPTASYASYVIADNIVLSAGNHTVQMIKNWGYFDLDYLKVEFLGTATGLRTIIQQNIIISSANKTIKVDAEEVYSLNIYNVSGALLINKTNQIGSTETAVDQAGFYIVEVSNALGKEIQKIAVR